MKKLKKLLFPVFFIILTIIIVYSIFRIEDMDIRDEAADTDFVNTYRGMARFGVGHLLDAFTNDDEMSELTYFRFGWFHNWYHKKEWICGVGRYTEASIPNAVDFYGFVGDWAPNETNCPQSLKDDIAEFHDGDVIWVGNELGWDDQRDPTTYARQYKSWYDCIKSVNPNIKVSPGANPGNPTWDYDTTHMNTWLNKEDTKGRWSASRGKVLNYIEYLTYAKDDYRDIYGVEMPLDAYVIHIYGMEGWHDIERIRNSIIAFRQYMKDGGHSRYHLYIKEMGILPSSEADWNKNAATMTGLFDMLLNLRDSSIGNPNDNNRLVQRWSWFVGPVACKESTAYDECLWKYTGFFHCKKVRENDASWNTDCITHRQETTLGVKYKEYVDSIWDSYDSQVPDKPEISYALNGNTANVTFSSSDNGRINNYEISVGSAAGEADVMIWTSTDTQTTYMINDAVGKFVNVKAIDDGYNWSDVSSREITEEEGDDPCVPDCSGKQCGDNGCGGSCGTCSEGEVCKKYICEEGETYSLYDADINNDDKVNMFDLSIVLNNWKWKKAERDEETDINEDEEVNMIDIAIVINNWTKKY